MLALVAFLYKTYEKLTYYLFLRHYVITVQCQQFPFY